MLTDTFNYFLLFLKFILQSEIAAFNVKVSNNWTGREEERESVNLSRSSCFANELEGIESLCCCDYVICCTRIQCMRALFTTRLATTSQIPWWTCDAWPSLCYCSALRYSYAKQFLCMLLLLFLFLWDTGGSKFLLFFNLLITKLLLLTWNRKGWGFCFCLLSLL